MSDGNDNSEMRRIYKVGTKDAGAMSSVVKPNYNVFPMFTVLPVDVPGPE
jgi:hypothetical protein